MLSKIEKIELLEKSTAMRKLCLEMIAVPGSSHVGGAMSIIDLLTVLYSKVLRVRPTEPKWAARDRLILSKGHAGPALYSALALEGYFPMEQAYTLNQPDTLLPSHCDMTKTIGIDMTAGSLGQGLSAGIGMAIAARLDKLDYNVYVIVGDGEQQEGQVWEAAMYAGHQKLENLMVFIDNNKMQIDDETANICAVDSIADKWAAFNFNVFACDGHDHSAILDAIQKAQAVKNGKPSAIVMDTVKGKGAVHCEGQVTSHSTTVTKDELAACIADLDDRLARAISCVE